MKLLNWLSDVGLWIMNNGWKTICIVIGVVLVILIAIAIIYKIKNK